MNAKDARLSSPQSLLMTTDQSRIDIIRAGLDVSGATIGRVLRPMILSPTISLKSWAWIVVAKIPALMRMDVTLALSRECRCTPEEIVSYYK